MISEEVLACFTQIEGRLYQCNICQNPIKEAISGCGDRKRHYVHKHTNVDKFICPICEKNFSYPSALRRHTRNAHKTCLEIRINN